MIKNQQIDGLSGYSTTNDYSSSGILHSIPQKMELVEQHSIEIMKLLGIELDDRTIGCLPARVASLFVNEWSRSVALVTKPVITLVPNPVGYNQMTVVKDIEILTKCSCHLLPVVNKVFIGYFGKQRPLDVSAIQQLVKFGSQHTHTQEELTIHISSLVAEMLDSNMVAVLVDATYHCSSIETHENKNTSIVTTNYLGRFINTEIKNEFLSYAGY